jgi:hypothetical protein
VDKVLVGQVPQGDPRYSDYEYIANYFSLQTSSWGSPFQVYRVYTPGNNQTTPYTNSLILNKKVFVPLTGNQYDDEAIEVYEEAMPGYEIIGIMHNNWANSDALHCRAKGVADDGMLYVKHMPILGDKPFQLEWNLMAEIIPYSGAGVVYDSTMVYYTVDGGDWQELSLDHGSGYNYSATFPFIMPGSDISYYIRTKDYSDRVKCHPYIGEPDPHTYYVNYAGNVTVTPDTLVFTTYEQMLDGLEFDVFNFTEGDLEITEMENEGMNLFHWYIDPWNLSLPHTMEFADTLTFNVKVGIPVNQLPGEFVYDTLDILTTNGLEQVFIKVDSDLITGLGNDPQLIASVESIFPNPAHDQVSITLNLESTSGVRLEVYGLDGRLISVLADQEMTVGSHEVRWNTNKKGQQVPAGIYIVRLQTEMGSISRKIAISR